MEAVAAMEAAEAAEVATDGRFHFSQSAQLPRRRALTSEFAMHGEAPSKAPPSAPTSAG
jgi:hypothetical protein